MRKITPFFLLFLGLIASPAIRSQSLQPTVVASDGGYAVLPSGIISWTLGETVTETFSSTGNFLTQGFQQPSALVINDVGDAGVNSLSVYPNPATDAVNVDLTQLPAAEYTIEVFDLLGNKVTSVAGVTPGIVTLPLTGLAGGMYMLTVSSAGFSQSYKVIKSR